MMDQKVAVKTTTSGLDRVSMALPHPLLLVGANGMIEDANPAAEAFFDMGLAFLQRTAIERLCGPNSSVASMVGEARSKGNSFNIYRVDMGLPRAVRAAAAELCAVGEATRTA